MERINLEIRKKSKPFSKKVSDVLALVMNNLMRLLATKIELDTGMCRLIGHQEKCLKKMKMLILNLDGK